MYVKMRHILSKSVSLSNTASRSSSGHAASSADVSSPFGTPSASSSLCSGTPARSNTADTTACGSVSQLSSSTTGRLPCIADSRC